MDEANMIANNSQSVADYLAQLLKDRKQLAAFPNLFLHVERVMDEEIIRVRSNLFQINGTVKEPLELPEADGSAVTLSEKVYVPVKEHPDFNFVGRILGPRGMTAKQLEQETGCKIMVRGRGSMRDKKKEEMNRGKPNWEHLNDELHVLITVEDTENRAQKKLQRAVEEINRLLVPAPDGEDELKKRQLIELAIINGTYRETNSEWNTAALLQQQLQQHCNGSASDFLLPSSDQTTPRLLSQAAAAAGLPGLMTSQVRTPVTLGAPLLLSPRLAAGPALISSLPSSVPSVAGLIGPADASMLYTTSPYAAPEYAQYAAQLAAAEFAAVAGAAEHNGVATSAGNAGKIQANRLLGKSRDHPYKRTGAGTIC